MDLPITRLVLACIPRRAYAGIAAIGTLGVALACAEAPTSIAGYGCSGVFAEMRALSPSAAAMVATHNRDVTARLSLLSRDADLSMGGDEAQVNLLRAMNEKLEAEGRLAPEGVRNRVTYARAAMINVALAKGGERGDLSPHYTEFMEELGRDTEAVALAARLRNLHALAVARMKQDQIGIRSQRGSMADSVDYAEAAIEIANRAGNPSLSPEGAAAKAAAYADTLYGYFPLDGTWADRIAAALPISDSARIYWEFATLDAYIDYDWDGSALRASMSRQAARDCGDILPPGPNPHVEACPPCIPAIAAAMGAAAYSGLGGDAATAIIYPVIHPSTSDEDYKKSVIDGSIVAGIAGGAGGLVALAGKTRWGQAAGNFIKNLAEDFFTWFQ